jgi:pyrimidine-specific ribonucleoside hydrolase
MTPTPPAERRPIILDVDTGIDDLVALLIAATAPELNLRGVMCVAGNVELRHVTRNTAKALAMLGCARRRRPTAPPGPAMPACAARIPSSAPPSSPRCPPRATWLPMSTATPAS